MIGHEVDAIFGAFAFDSDPGDARGDLDEMGFDCVGSRTVCEYIAKVPKNQYV